MTKTISECLSTQNIESIRNAELSEYTTFRLGGPCKALLICKTPEELISTVQCLTEYQEKFILIGGGSNLVVSDQGLDCYVIRYLTPTPIIKKDNNGLVVSGSTILDDLAIYAIKQSLSGINYCSGIPGTVGGAVVGNAGAFGQQIGDIVETARVISKQGKIKTLTHEQLQFTYRHSHLKETSDILIDVTLKMSSGKSEDLANQRSELLAIRKEKHPNLKTHPCAGSFFRNIEPTSKAERRQAAGWFLEEAGGKNLQIGGAKIFDKHANIIIKSKGCKASDVLSLSQKMQNIVKDKFALDLRREVRFVGNFPNHTHSNENIIW